MSGNGDIARAVMDPATISAVEKEVGALVQRINDGMAPSEVAKTIGAHTKSIIARTTAESRGRLNTLFTELRAMDEFLVENEVRLCAAVDEHVEIANGAAKAAGVVSETLASWRKRLQTVVGAA